VTLHGGPGAGHDYLESLEALAENRTVVYYDQLGCGRSDRPDDPSLWKMERFVDEVDTVRRALGLEHVHLLGQSWGGWLAIEYMLSGARGVLGLVLASTSASISQFVTEAERLKAALPPEVYETLRRYEDAGELHHPDYEDAVMEFYRRHLCRLDPWPDPLVRSVENLDGNQVYETINGLNEFFAIGNLKDWNRAPRRDTGADAGDRRALRRDHTGLCEDAPSRHTWFKDEGFRRERARCAPGRDRSLRRGGGRFPGAGRGGRCYVKHCIGDSRSTR
jgi:proline-specific peptidase